MRFVDALPLVEGLEERGGVELFSDAPSRLGRLLADDRADVALLSSIELQRIPAPLTVIPAGCVSSRGATFTVRVFSQVPADRIEVLWTDMDADSSVVLARLLWAENYDRALHVIPFEPDYHELPEDAEAVLLVGDKVVANPPPLGYERQFDLGAMWFEMTGLPFVFAVWTAGAGADLDRAYRLLSNARRSGMEHLERIAREYAPVHGWPDDLALRYLTRHLEFEFTEEHREGMEEFFERAEDFRLIDHVRPVRYYRP